MLRYIKWEDWSLTIPNSVQRLKDTDSTLNNGPDLFVCTASFKTWICENKMAGCRFFFVFQEVLEIFCVCEYFLLSFWILTGRKLTGVWGSVLHSCSIGVGCYHFISVLSSMKLILHEQWLLNESSVNRLERPIGKQRKIRLRVLKSMLESPWFLNNQEVPLENKR